MITKSIKEKIKQYFFLNPTKKLRIRQIEREVKVPLPLAIRYSKELESEGILKSSIIANVKLYSADRSSRIFLMEKKLFNLQSLFYSGLVDHLAGIYGNPAIAVFGSYSRGEDTEESDIDIYIETPKKEIVELADYEKKLRRKIQVFRYGNIRDIKNKELANNILNGITLNGFLEVFR